MRPGSEFHPGHAECPLTWGLLLAGREDRETEQSLADHPNSKVHGIVFWHCSGSRPPTVGHGGQHVEPHFATTDVWTHLRDTGRFQRGPDFLCVLRLSAITILGELPLKSIERELLSEILPEVPARDCFDDVDVRIG